MLCSSLENTVHCYFITQYSIELISSVPDCYPGPPAPDHFEASAAPMQFGRPSDPPPGGWCMDLQVPHVAGGMLQLTLHCSVFCCELHLFARSSLLLQAKLSRQPNSSSLVFRAT